MSLKSIREVTAMMGLYYSYAHYISWTQNCRKSDSSELWSAPHQRV